MRTYKNGLKILVAIEGAKKSQEELVVTIACDQDHQQEGVRDNETKLSVIFSPSKSAQTM